jgi:signal transduction histidine kinase
MTIGTLLVGVIAFFLIMRDNARQRELAAMNLRQAEAAEAASRAKSRFLTMMSHELRNPLNGILGPLALVGQSEIGERQARMIQRAQQSGRMMLRMLRGLLDYGDIQDERMVLREEVFRPKHLAEEVRVALADTCAPGASRARVSLCAGMPDMVWGDPDRLAQVFIHLAEYVIDPENAGGVAVRFSHDGTNLLGTVEFDDPQERLAWKLNLLTGLGDEAYRTFASDALGPLIARGLLKAAQGLLTLERDGDRHWRIRVSVPARKVVFDKIVVRVETRSAALETLYRAALRSDRIEFAEPSGEARADVVLADSTSAGEQAVMRGLRARFPNAVFVSLGTPEMPGIFDEVVDAPSDLVRLRESVLGRLAS